MSGRNRTESHLELFFLPEITRGILSRLVGKKSFEPGGDEVPFWTETVFTK